VVRVGVDIGGSGVRAAVVSADASVGPVSRRALASRAPDEVLRTVLEVVRPLRPEVVGVGVPGFVREGTVLASPNFPEVRDWPLAASLTDALGCRVAVHNDANAAALGAWALDGRERDVVLLTLGTGVGGGVVSEGRLLTGRRGVAAELGHLYVGGDHPCGCGGRGCLETWLSTSGFRARAAERGLKLASGAELLALADTDPVARAVLDDGLGALADGLVTLLNLFAPELLVLSGGLAQAQEVLAPAVDRAMRRAIPTSVAGLEVRWLGRADSLAIAGAVEGL